MKIAIDCCDLDHSRIDGTRVYIKNVLNHLGGLAPNDQFLLYHQKDFNPALVPKMFSNYVERKIPYPFFWTQTRLTYELKKDAPDVCWMPIQQIPFVGPKKTKYVVTMHDLAWKYFGDQFPLGDRLKLDFFTASAVKRADKLIAISESTKKDILKFYSKINPEKVAIVYHGFEKELFSRRYDQQEVDEVLRKYGIVENESGSMNHESGTECGMQNTEYLFYIGAIQPRKNLVRLIEAFDELKERKKSDLKLVLAGEVAWKAEKTLEAVKKAKYAKDIVLTGKVDFCDLAKLYQGAEVFVFPALYEGFGIPLLEAFASGVPVVSADNSSLREVGGEAAKYFDAENVKQLVDTLQVILENRIIGEEMIEEGKKRAEIFSWEKCAKETLEVLREK